MAKSKIRASHAMIALATTISPIAWNAAWAQPVPEDAKAAAAAGAPSDQIEDIVVTAQRRSESAQDVPISLQSFSSDTLRKSAVRSSEDLTSVVGGLIIQPTAARPAVFIRGVGTNSSNTTPAVLTFLDGVYMPFGQSSDLVNISSVEVLKGPQGTLFGRNATGGVIQITTRPPSEDLGARVEVGYGNYQTVDTSAYLTGGLGKGVAMDAALHYVHQDKGYGQNVATGGDVFFTNKFSARSRLRVELSDATNLTLSGDYSQVEGTVGTNVSPAVGYDFLFVGGAIRRRGPGQFYPGASDVNATFDPSYKAKEWGTSLTFETEFSGLTLRNIASYRRSEEHIHIDFDGTPANAIDLRINREPRTAFTEELQLLSGSGGPLQWVAGLFYYRSKAEMGFFDLNILAPVVPRAICNLPPPGTAPCRRQAFSKDTDESVAAYGQATYEILTGTKLTLGARYTIEKRKIDGGVLVNGVNDPNRAGEDSQKFNELTWRAAIDHSFTPNAMVYASVSKGFNAGFFNQSSTAGFATRAQNPAVAPEFLTAYEIGAKTDLLDRHLRFNISAFLYDYKGLQQQIYDQGAVVTINAGSARMKGIDLEVVARPVSSLTLSLSGTYLDSKYNKYPFAPDYRLRPDGSVTVEPPLPGSVGAKGKDVTQAPRLSWTASVSHVLSTSIGEFTTSANLNYRGKTFIDPMNRFRLPTRYLLNATERWTSSDRHLFASLWVKNLLNKRYDFAVNILTPAGLVGNTAPPRTYGVSAGFEF